MELVIGTKAREKEWASRHLRRGNDWNDMQHLGEDDEWVMSYWDSQNHSHRPLLLEKIASYSPDSVLEIGCNCGPNLYLIARRFPDIEIRGVDINPRAIEKGKELFGARKIFQMSSYQLVKQMTLGRFKTKGSILYLPMLS